MLVNTKMAVDNLESIETQNENSVLLRVERIYSKQRQLKDKLLEINTVIIGSDNPSTPELNADCIMAYLDETESVLNSTLDLAYNILQVIK